MQAARSRLDKVARTSRRARSLPAPALPCRRRDRECARQPDPVSTGPAKTPGRVRRWDGRGSRSATSGRGQRTCRRRSSSAYHRESLIPQDSRGGYSPGDSPAMALASATYSAPGIRHGCGRARTQNCMSHVRSAVAGVALTLVAGCGGSRPAVPTPAPTPVAVSTPPGMATVPTPQAALAVIPVQVTYVLRALTPVLDSLFPARDSLAQAACQNVARLVCHQYGYQRDPLRSGGDRRPILDQYDAALPRPRRGARRWHRELRICAGGHATRDALDDHIALLAPRLEHRLARDALRRHAAGCVPSDRAENRCDRCAADRWWMVN